MDTSTVVVCHIDGTVSISHIIESGDTPLSDDDIVKVLSRSDLREWNRWFRIDKSSLPSRDTRNYWTAKDNTVVVAEIPLSKDPIETATIDDLKARIEKLEADFARQHDTIKQR